MYKLSCFIVISALVLGMVQNAASATFNNVVIFGDSLSDSGQYGSRFTTNPGLTTLEYVAGHYGYVVTPSSFGGTDYAYGGARVTLLPGVPDAPPTATAQPVTNQISAYLATGSPDRNALYAVWAGANDIFHQTGLAGAGLITSEQLQTNLMQAANDELSQIARLQAAGARNIIVINLPDIGSSPFGQQEGAATFSSVSSLYNFVLNNGLAQMGPGIIPINSYDLLNEILANPAMYGFTNTTLPACTTTSSIFCSPATLREADAANTYVFADGVHPTTGAHQVVAQYIESVIEAPEKIGMLAEAPLQVMQTQKRAVDGRFFADDNQRENGKFELFASYDYNESTFDASSTNPGTDGSGHTMTFGGDIQVSNALSLGMLFGYGQTTTDFNANTGDFKLNAASLSAYTLYRQQSFYIGGMATIADLDYQDIDRNIPLGTAIRTESGKTAGFLGAVGMTGGYLIPTGNLTHGPVAGFTYQDVNVDSYWESGDNSTTMRFGDQDRKSMVGNLGYQVFGKVQISSATFLPFARLAFEHEFKADDRTVSAGLAKTMHGTFSMPTFKPDENIWKVDVGTAMEICPNSSVFLSYSGTVNQANDKVNAVTIGLKWAF